MAKRKPTNPDEVRDFGEERVCTVCRFKKPANEFLVGGCYTRRCIGCRADTKRLRVHREEIDKHNENLMAVLTAAGNSNSTHISELADAVLREMGGLEVYASHLNKHLIAAMEKNIASPDVFKVLKGISEMVYQSTQARDTAPDLSQLSTEDLERLVAELARTAMEPESESA